MARSALGVAVVFNLSLLVVVHSRGTWGWWFTLGCVLFLAFMWWLVERSRVRYEQAVDRVRWDLAAATDDPVGALAVMGYMDSLSPEQRRELRSYMVDPEVLARTEWDDLPPVVKGMFLVAVQPPREEDR